MVRLIQILDAHRRCAAVSELGPAPQNPMTDAPRVDAATKLAILVEGASTAGAAEAHTIKDGAGDPATLTACGERVLLLRVLDKEKKGFDRIDVFVLGDEDADTDINFDDDGEDQNR
jgi:hypothetical protein